MTIKGLNAVERYTTGPGLSQRAKRDLATLFFPKKELVGQIEGVPLAAHCITVQKHGFGDISTPGHLDAIFFGIITAISSLKTLLTTQGEIKRDAFIKLMTSLTAILHGIVDSLTKFGPRFKMISTSVSNSGMQIAAAILAPLSIVITLIELALRSWQLFRQVEFDKTLDLKTGSTQQKLDRLFDEFFLVDGTRTDRNYIASFKDLEAGVSANAKFKLERFYRRVHSHKLVKQTMDLFKECIAEGQSRPILPQKLQFRAIAVLNQIEKKSKQVKIIHAIAIASLVTIFIVASCLSAGALPGAVGAALLITPSISLFISNILEVGSLPPLDKKFDYRFLLPKFFRSKEFNEIQDPAKLELTFYTQAEKYRECDIDIDKQAQVKKIISNILASDMCHLNRHVKALKALNPKLNEEIKALLNAKVQSYNEWIKIPSADRLLSHGAPRAA
jgi:hypothetical protein